MEMRMLTVFLKAWLEGREAYSLEQANRHRQVPHCPQKAQSAHLFSQTPQPG